MIEDLRESALALVKALSDDPAFVRLSQRSYFAVLGLETALGLRTEPTEIGGGPLGLEPVKREDVGQ